MGKSRSKASKKSKKSFTIANRSKQSSKKAKDKSQSHNPAIQKSKFKAAIAAQSQQGPSNAERSKSKKKRNVFEEAREKLEGARFRYLNEQLYTKTSSEAWELFQEDPESFHVYHQGFRNQVSKWPVNPIDLIISSISKMSKSLVIADFGCGEAKLAQSVKNTVHSFDLVAANERVTACDMANVPLDDESVDIAVFCLSFMGTNINEFLLEANRVLRIGGHLMVAEVSSRCKNVESFVQMFKKFGFQPVNTDTTNDYFFLSDLKKVRKLDKAAVLPKVLLKPCVYKKR